MKQNSRSTIYLKWQPLQICRSYQDSVGNQAKRCKKKKDKKKRDRKKEMRRGTKQASGGSINSNDKLIRVTRFTSSVDKTKSGVTYY